MITALIVVGSVLLGIATGVAFVAGVFMHYWRR